MGLIFDDHRIGLGVVSIFWLINKVNGVLYYLKKMLKVLNNGFLNTMGIKDVLAHRFYHVRESFRVL